MATERHAREGLNRHLDVAAGVIRETGDVCGDSILQAAEVIAAAFRGGRKLLLCGNGGSAAECQHLAAEFTHRLSANTRRRALPAIALTTDTSLLTAYANDCGFEGIFARQVEALGQAGDVLLLLTTSGASPNLLRAVQDARERKLTSIVLMGASGPLQSLVDVAICIPSQDTQHVQEAHLPVIHLLCALVEREFVESASAGKGRP